MVIDTSALITILTGEPDAQLFASAIADDPKKLLSSFSMLEAGIVIESKKGESGTRELELLIHKIKIDIVSLDSEQIALAIAAWRKFGKGRHPAGLNIGDCCSYALAKYSNEPVLFKGNYFDKTDIPTVNLSMKKDI